jgi:uncharacterized protein (DUF1778 family)
MPQEKSVPISFRLTPRMRSLLQAAAHHQQRSLTNTVEVLVEAYCKQHGLAVKEPAISQESTEREYKA